MRVALSLAVLCGLGAAALAAVPNPVFVQGADAESTQSAVERAREQARDAKARGDRLEREAEKADGAAARSAREAAALAARVQQAEAERVLAEAQLRAVGRERGRLEADLAARQRPLVGLTATLQRLSRTPPAFAVLRPGTVEETVRARALMSAMLPVIERRTIALRREVSAIRQVERNETAAIERLRTTETRLAERRRNLLESETQQRLASRRLGSDAAREEERALALAERARDLTGMLDTIDESASLRARLAALPGPKVRPARPGAATVAEPAVTALETAASPDPYILPANGRLAEGFGGSSRGLTLAVESGALIAAPGAGRVAFAGPYSGYGRIVIVEHANGWTSLVTGIGRLDVRVGEEVVAGSSLGVADPRRGRVILELRRRGEPVNPLPRLR
jgi:septal ring factor EnvC (AmiA/AmiB activator)